MRIQTFKNIDTNTVPFCMKDGKQVVISFTHNGGLFNAAHLHMTPKKARQLAEKLIVNADKFDNE